MIVQFIVALATTSKAFSKIFEEAVTLYYYQKLESDRNLSAEVAEEREKIIAELSKEGISDEDKRKARTRLIALSRL